MYRVATGAVLVLAVASLAGIGYAAETTKAEGSVEEAALLAAYAGPVPGSMEAVDAIESNAAPDEVAETDVAPEEAAIEETTGEETAPQTGVSAEAWASSDCGACHAEGQADSADAPSLASSHMGRGVSCIACHTDEERLGEIHAEADPTDKTPNRLRKTDIDSAACTVSGCHDDAAALVEATEGVTVLTDQDGLTVNPHAVPPSESHASVTCGSCHIGHTEPDYQKACTRCHHENVYECGTCHA